MMKSNIRNFVIIAHIDHGKSTLADRFLEITGTISPHKMRAQYLDALELERERGITIKMAPVRMTYHPYREPFRGLTQIKADSRGLLYEDLTYKIRGALFNIYNSLGPGHKEGVYQNALAVEFDRVGLSFEREKRVDVIYGGTKVGLYQPDFVVEGKVIIELKALPFLGGPPKKQTRYYLKGSNYKLALLVNFGGKDLEIERIIYDSIRDDQHVDPRESASDEYPRKSALNPRESADSEFILNLIDTPGHSDFSYEVSRALRAVEGAILLVDATQGIQAQTLANLEIAKRAGLKIIGVLNKVDLKPVGMDELQIELADLIGVKPSEIHRVSGKTGEGVRELLDELVRSVSPPKTLHEQAALIFSSLYDDHKGVIAFVRVFGGEFKKSDLSDLQAVHRQFKIKEVGYFAPEFSPTRSLRAGEIGYIATGIKEPDAIRIGDTVGEKVLPGYQLPQPVIFVSIYPSDASEYDEFKVALGKLKLNDSSLTFTPEMSEVLGRGFKFGFLGRLHFEITIQRLEREFQLEVVSSFPSVAYKVLTAKGEEIVENPKDFPESYTKAWEPYVEVKMLAPQRFMGALLELTRVFRFGEIKTHTFGQQVELTAELPLADLILDFDDRLKSASQGFASFSYEFLGFKEAKVKKLDVLVAGEVVPGLSRIVSEEYLESEARKMAERLKELLPRQQFAQAIQAVTGAKILAREDIPALKKNVTGHLYGGDRTRKMKLWKKQEKGKKKLKERGRVTISADVFKELLKK